MSNCTNGCAKKKKRKRKKRRIPFSRVQTLHHLIDPPHSESHLACSRREKSIFPPPAAEKCSNVWGKIITSNYIRDPLCLAEEVLILGEMFLKVSSMGRCRGCFVSQSSKQQNNILDLLQSLESGFIYRKFFYSLAHSLSLFFVTCVCVCVCVCVQ